MSQLSFATLDHRNKKKQTKRERFLSEMDAVVPWAALLGLIEPHYPRAGNGRRPYPLAVMLRIYFLQQWYQLSDPGAEEALYDIQSMRAFAELAVKLHEVIPGQGDAADGWLAAEASMRTVPVIAMQPARKFVAALS
jgi:hypothetical protein